LIIEQHRRERAAQVPFQVIGQHAQQHVRPDPRRGPVEHRAQLKIRPLQRTECPLDMRQALVGPHGGRGVGLLGSEAQVEQ
jgi:hypothetical protein